MIPAINIVIIPNGDSVALNAPIEQMTAMTGTSSLFDTVMTFDKIGIRQIAQKTAVIFARKSDEMQPQANSLLFVKSSGPG